jgi:hypothetical protein
MHQPPMAEPTEVVLETAAGDQTVAAQLYRFDHLPGGIVFWPQGQPAYKAARLRVGGSDLRLAR